MEDRFVIIIIPFAAQECRKIKGKQHFEGFSRVGNECVTRSKESRLARFLPSKKAAKEVPSL